MKSNVSAKITGIKYRPHLCRKLETFDLKNLEDAITKCGSFMLRTEAGNYAVSWWVSAKRTRSYPYARVYDTYGFGGRKITIIPIVKDEGAGGDRDFLQWDTISLMSLLGIYVIVAYYADASPSRRFKNKITDQRFDYGYIRRKISEIAHYQSDALHWNLLQINELESVAEKARGAYAKISKKTKVKMHSPAGLEKRIKEIAKGKESFIEYSRDLAKRAQHSESRTKHRMEKLSGTKGILTIKNYLGGNYYFTADEIKVKGSQIYLVEGKNTKNDRLPALEDIKDGLLKMIIFCNLREVTVGGKILEPCAILKLTAKQRFSITSLPKNQKETLKTLTEEAKENGFGIIINGRSAI